MCGIFGYSGKQISNEIIVEGIKRLEYRGYDSWGMVINEKGKLHQHKEVGSIKGVPIIPRGYVGIAHTRWATHGGVCKGNAHPHFSKDKSFALVQNGIVENFSLLKKTLQKKGHIFKTQTDTEVIVRLIEENLKKYKTLDKSIIQSFKELEGRNTIAIVDNKGTIYAVRNGSPLVLGISNKGIFLASDSLSFSNHTNRVVLLDNFDMVTLKENTFEIYNIKDNRKKEIEIQEQKEKYEEIEKDGYEHFMLKEIIEQKKTILTATKYIQKELKPLIQQIHNSHKVYIVGAGTAGFAAGQIAYYLRHIAGIDAQDVRSYEFYTYENILKSNDLILAISQSGETADTIEAIEIAKKKGCMVGSIVNMLSTTISRLSDYPYYTNAGPEICVASTKVFTSQCAFGYLLSKCIKNEEKDAKDILQKLSVGINEIFSESSLKNIQNIVSKIIKHNHMFILGKGENCNIAMEGALKIKEISYKHVEGFMAGELKHGVIALIEKGTPVFSIINERDSRDMISASLEVKARGALIIGIGDIRYKEYFDFFIPTVVGSSISNVIPFQLISYYLAKSLGNNIDKPRNLAKSVTVK